MNVPDHVRQQLRDKLWRIADHIDWLSLSPTEKSHHYEAWTRDAEIGGLIAHYIPIGDVRVYIKDTLIKDFARSRLADGAIPCRVLGIPHSIEVVRNYVKPHGRQFKDGRIISWGRANAWKAILMAMYERAYGDPLLKAYGIALTHAFGRYKQARVRTMVERASRQLGIDHLVWVEH